MTKNAFFMDNFWGWIKSFLFSDERTIQLFLPERQSNRSFLPLEPLPPKDCHRPIRSPGKARLLSGYQVQNMGVSGYDIGQYYLYLQRNISKLDRLSLLILSITSGNDLIDGATNSVWGKRKPLYIINNSKLLLTQVPIFKYCFRNVISKSYLINRLAKKNKKFF